MPARRLDLKPLLLCLDRRCTYYNIYQFIQRRHCVQGSALPARQLDIKLLILCSARCCTYYNIYQSIQRRHCVQGSTLPARRLRLHNNGKNHRTAFCFLINEVCQNVLHSGFYSTPLYNIIVKASFDSRQ